MHSEGLSSKVHREGVVEFHIATSIPVYENSSSKTKRASPSKTKRTSPLEVMMHKNTDDTWRTINLLKDPSWRPSSLPEQLIITWPVT